jgi:prepilin-type N-terminal cleavage/methylation domain-containing protein/prepilin-type processing-associated H-X9-DG protein
MRQRKAFTMVEILIVVGIIAVLVAIVVPTISQAKRAGKRSVCLSNERQLAMAMSAYCANNSGRLPAPASVNESPNLTYDFVFWQSGRDIRQSALATYMNWTGLSFTAAGKPITPAVLICPADDLSRTVPATGAGTYPYSYVMNSYINGVASGGFPSAKQPNLLAVNAPSQKALLFEEDGLSMDDGSGNMDPAVVAGTAPTTPYINQALLCGRHSTDSTTNPNTIGNLGLRGNVGFCDGHAEYISRVQFTQTYLTENPPNLTVPASDQNVPVMADPKY